MFLLLLLIAHLFRLDLRTNAGRDWQALIMGDTSSTGTGTYAPANYMGLTANTGAVDATHTTLAGEIVVGTLVRAQAAFAHTTGLATYTLSKTFTSDQGITIHKIGMFNSGAGGTMAFEVVLNADAPVVSGDQLTITETVTL